MTENELHRVATLAKAEMAIELMFAYIYDDELGYHHDNGEQGYFGSVIRTVLDQMDGLMDETVERETVYESNEGHKDVDCVCQ